MQRIINKKNGKIYESENLYDDLLERAELTVTAKLKSGKVMRRKIRKASDLFEGKIPQGKSVIIVFNNMLTATGIFESIDEYDDGFGIVLKSKKDDIAPVIFKTDNIIGYMTE